MDLGVINTALTNVAKFVNDVKKYTGFITTSSLTDVAKLTRVEPLTILSKDLINLDYMVDVNQALLSMFSAYYLQAISVLTTINDVEVVKILDALNPDRDSTGFLMGERVSRETYGNLVLENYEHKLPGTSRVAIEDTKENIDAINTISNLSVGKLLHVRINLPHMADKISFDYAEDIGGSHDKSESTTTMNQNKSGKTDSDSITGTSTQTGSKDNESNKTHSGFRVERDTAVIIPIAVRLMASIIPNATITHLLTLKTEDNSLVERYHAWRSGRISFIKDLIFCQDIINEYKKAMIGDDSGTMLEIIRRVNNSKKFGLLTKNPSLVSASNLFVISETVAREIETKLGGKLSNARIRDKAFDNTYAMIIAVVDREWERVTFYTRGLSASTDLSIKEIKAVSKNKSGIDIGDLLKSLQMGSPMSF